jgi:hypothetical protein
MAGVIGTGLIAVIAGGCVEREERITIDQEGGVRMQLRFEADSFDELHGGDAVPTLAGGWVVEERMERDADDEETYFLTAEAMFAPGAKLPANLADPLAHEPGVNLQFPTEVTVERRRDGTYFHFHRTYEPRAWAFNAPPRVAIEEKLRELEDRDLRGLSLGERRELVGLFVAMETQKYAYFARSAFEDALEDVPQDAYLHVYAAIDGVGDALDVEAIAELLAAPQDETQEEALEAYAKAFEIDTLKAMKEALRDRAGLGAHQVDAFERRYEWHTRYHGITEELANDTFRIVVELPGEIVGHNGDGIEDGGVVWEFAGDFVRDRTMELMATSRVAR